jgi:hypothetical protein
VQNRKEGIQEEKKKKREEKEKTKRKGKTEITENRDERKETRE